MVSVGAGGSSKNPPSYSEVMQTINDYVGYYASSFNCNITPSHNIYISITFNPDAVCESSLSQKIKKAVLEGEQLHEVFDVIPMR